MATASGTEVSRRQALRRGAAAGAVIWTAPIVMSTTAHASNGSNGSVADGPCRSITCCWNQRFWQRKQGTSFHPANDFSDDTFCEVDYGQGFKVIKFFDTFTVPAGVALRFRPLQTNGPGRSALPPDSEPVDEPIATTTTTADVPTTTIAEVSTTLGGGEPAPVETAAPPVEGAPTATSTPEPTVTTTPVAPPPPAPPLVVDTIVIDMSGRTDLNIGDVYGFFQVVDAEPA